MINRQILIQPSNADTTGDADNVNRKIQDDDRDPVILVKDTAVDNDQGVQRIDDSIQNTRSSLVLDYDGARMDGSDSPDSAYSTALESYNQISNNNRFSFDRKYQSDRRDFDLNSARSASEFQARSKRKNLIRGSRQGNHFDTQHIKQSGSRNSNKKHPLTG